MAVEYQRDLPADSPREAIEATEEHVRDQVAAIAAGDDDPSHFRPQVQTWMARHPDNPDLIRIEGYLDADPDVEYLRDDFLPWAGVDPKLYETEIAAAVADMDRLAVTDDG